MGPQAFLAFDLGAESGRAMLAVFDGTRLDLEEVHRFPNQILDLPGGLHWNLTGLWSQMLQGLVAGQRRAKERGVPLVSLGVDTWGVDYALVGAAGQLLGLPRAYRDPRNHRGMRRALREAGRQAIYQATGIQFMFFNTLNQLVAARQAEPEVLKAAHRLLFMPDLLHYFFTGKAVNEATIASTSQMIDPRSGTGRRPGNGKWALPLLKKLKLPVGALGRLVPAGTRLGKVRKDLAAELGIEPIEVVLPGSHDTASAVAAVPVDESVTPDWAYLSSGTWSLMGVELHRPLITDAAREAGFTHERGVGGRIRFLRNIAGLWLVQEVRRDFARRGQEFDYPALTRMAGEAEPFRTLVDPNHGPFIAPGDMAGKLAAFARATGQAVPESPGQCVRCCLESLALCYRRTLDGLEQLLQRRIGVLHIVGGGGRNDLLNQFTADALGRCVVVGPYEATAIGNALAQGMGLGHIRDLAHLRAVVRASFSPATVVPGNAAAFEAQRERFAGLVSG